MLATLSNLFPRPDQPRRGLFNLHLFKAMAEALSAETSSSRREPGTAAVSAVPPLQNICLVPEWRWWRWAGIAAWDSFRPEETDVDLFPTHYQPVWYAPGIGRDWNWKTYARSLRRVDNIVRWRKAVLATWLYPDGVAAARLADRLSIPCWIMVQGSDVFHLRYPRRRRAILEAASAVEGYFCVSHPLAESLARAGIAARKIHVVPNGVDTRLFRYRSQAEAAVLLSERLANVRTAWDPTDLSVQYVLFVGNLVSVKNPELLLDAWAHLCRESGKGAVRRRLVIIGTGPLAPSLHRQARRLGVRETTLLLGSRPQSEVAIWMNRADALCLTSVSEGMPNVVLEALASGLPVVATDVGACREILAHEPAARLCVSGDRLGLSRGLGDILAAGYDRRDMADRNRERHSWMRQARTILETMGMLKPSPAAEGGTEGA